MDTGFDGTKNYAAYKPQKVKNTFFSQSFQGHN